ncbi:hypothetical protein BJX99DRAFT_258427 [Aspergillus californicus]
MSSAQIVERRLILCHGGSVWPGNWQSTAELGKNYAQLDHYPKNPSKTSITTIWEGRLNYALSRDSITVHNMGSDIQWDLSDYGAIEIRLGRSDGKLYHFIIQDDSGYKWRAGFHASTSTSVTTRVIPFSSFRNWRSFGDQAPEHPLQLARITGIGIYYSNIDAPQGKKFFLNISSIGAVKPQLNSAKVTKSVKEQVTESVREQDTESREQVQPDRLRKIQDKVKGKLESTKRRIFPDKTRSER